MPALAPRIGAYLPFGKSNLRGGAANRDQGSSGDFGTGQRTESASIRIDGGGDIYATAFLADGKYILSGGNGRSVRAWRVEDGKEVGWPIDAKSAIRSIGVSPDGKWVACGLVKGSVMIWGAEDHEMAVTTLKGHKDAVFAVDFSPDGTTIVTGSDDRSVCVWSVSSSQLFLGPWQHGCKLAAAKFSPDGQFIATATWQRESIRVYDSRSGDLLVNFPVKVNSAQNQCLTWVNDSKHLFALPQKGNVVCLDIPNRTTQSEWRVHGSNYPTCIAMPQNGAFIAVSDVSSVSFWDPTTHEQIGSVIDCATVVWSLAISSNFDIAVVGGKTITVRNLRDVLPPQYLDGSSTGQTEETILDIPAQEGIPPPRAREGLSSFGPVGALPAYADLPDMGPGESAPSLRARESLSSFGTINTELPAYVSGVPEDVLENSAM